MSVLLRESPPFSYADVAPLDWFHLRALLWEAWPLATRSSSADDWASVAALANARAGGSPPLPPAAYRHAFERLAAVAPDSLTHGDSRDIGYHLWNHVLYERAQGLFARPVFMNLGYVGGETSTTLQPEDEPYRLFIQMYERTLRRTPLRGREVLEIGCGAGGGCDYMFRYHQPSALTGLDLEEANLATCRRGRVASHVSFIRGTAEALPFPPKSFDVVVNIESSGGYARPDAFLREVRRVLRPGGRFLFSDLRPVDEEWGPDRTAAALPGQMRVAGLEPIEGEDITANVLASIEIQEHARRQVLDDLGLDPHERAHFDEIMLCRGSRNGAKLLNGQMQYWSFVCERGA